MKEIEELKNMLGKVEGKLIAAAKMYAAMNFSFWLFIMAGFYVLLELVNFKGIGLALYWMAAIVIGIPFTIKLWSRVERLQKIQQTGKKRKIVGAMIAIPWIVGSIIGWMIIPSMQIALNAEARLAVGFLSFIGISIGGMWLVVGREFEMVPAFLIPLCSIPVVWNMEEGAMIWAGFVVTASYSITVFWYLYSAFKAIERW
ncbi:hypothetical protein [Thermococcus barophilus]|uniref:Uncharacterized protein n=1 Tax=Thermococcus barophilus (strain DSM 11836 / MP) TaxID=391623 RepID=F0LKY9_THEBM|nr:hypothetical protein [Thermococcus barophilus]ADT84896.1 hypothetical protein TERMP_01921 [Thermococcus barophilus MP]